MAETKLGVSGTDVNQLSGGAFGNLFPQDIANQAMSISNQLYPQLPEPDPWEAAFQFFAEMGRQASQPGATVLGSAVGSMQAPLDYLNAKKKEKAESDRARMQSTISLGTALKGKDKVTYRPATDDELAQYGATAGQMGSDGKFYDLTDKTSSTFKERKFYKIGFPAAVAKNKADADAFEADKTWSTIPPEGWEDDTSVTEVQSSKILDGGVVVTVMKDGTTKVLDAAGNELEGDKREEAIRQAEDRGITIQGERAGQRRAATVAVNTSLSAFDQVSKSRSNIATLEEAKRLVLEEGANTGVIANRLPNWKASTIALDTVKNELGLDVVGSVTFGALSEGELNLALSTALPTNLSEEDLVDWIDRKIVAQQKLQEYLYNQAIFLADGDKTIGDWLRLQREEKEESDRTEAERRKSGTNYNFTTMPKEEILQIDIDTLDSAQFDKWEKRMDELGL
jgi:hypothetical protein